MNKSNHELEKERDKRIGEYFLAQERLGGYVVSSERPDLDYHLGNKIIGIELTELVPINSKSRLPGVDRVLARCQEIHEKKDYPIVRCFVDFDTTLQITKISTDKIAEEIMRILTPSLLRTPKSGSEIKINTSLPDGIHSVSIHAPITGARQSEYSSPYVVSHELLQLNHITNCVSGKEQLLKNYRSGLDEYWLVIHFGHPPGERWFIGPSPDLYDEFPIKSMFDRVYLLTPQIEGAVWQIR